MSGPVTSCGGCGSVSLVELFDMGLQPLAEGGSDRSYPLALLRCGNCSLVQLSYAVDQARVFRPAHPYSTGNSAVLREHYAKLTKQLAWDMKLESGDVVVDIGANDGTLLNSYPGDYGLQKIAVEPTDQILRCAPGIIRFQEFFTAVLAEKIRSQYGTAKVITACNVLAHVPDVHDFLDGVTVLLDGDGEFVTENHDLVSITSGLQIDTVYHEHLRYYTVGTLSHLLERHGLHVTSSQQIPTHGGSFRLRAARENPGFPARARCAATALRAILWQLADRHQVIYGIGATTRATPLICYAGIAGFITAVCEVPGSDKIGTNMPGTAIPVVDESRLIADSPPYALVFAWHMKDGIIAKLRAAGYQGRFIVPLPEPKVIDER